MCYCPSKKSDVMYYNQLIVSDKKSLELVYRLLNKNDTTSALPVTEHIRNTVKRQAILFPEGIKFDYRLLFEDGKECTFDKYFDEELMHTVDLITTSDWSIHTNKMKH